MANTASARKRIRQNEVRNARNTARMSRVRTFVKKVETAILAGKKDDAVVALREAQPELQRAVGKGVMHANTVARRISRLSARIKSLSAAQYTAGFFASERMPKVMKEAACHQ